MPGSNFRASLSTAKSSPKRYISVNVAGGVPFAAGALPLTRQPSAGVGAETIVRLESGAPDRLSAAAAVKATRQPGVPCCTSAACTCQAPSQVTESGVKLSKSAFCGVTRPEVWAPSARVYVHTGLMCAAMTHFSWASAMYDAG